MLLLVGASYATIKGFTRIGTIPIPEANLNNGGVGNMIVGKDVDGDGKLDLYLVNDNWNDGPTELVPRIYKLEQNGANWEVVWQATSSIPKQNTWPQLAITDLDKDGKKELVWAIINFTDATLNPNPPRIVVYEQQAANSDIFGVDDGSGGYRPNAQWSIADIDMTNIRPIDWEIVDIDGDGTDEIVFADRVGASTGSYGLYFGVVSVDKIPDNGDGSEVWTMETSGKDLGVTTAAQNKWDVVVIPPRAYFFSETEITKLVYDNGGWDYESLSPLAGGSMVQSARAVDLDKDGTKEIFGAVYDWGNDAYKGVYLLQESGDTLKATEIFNMAAYWPTGTRGPWGSACADIDGDGYLDFVFGSRNATPNAAIFLCSYKGGDITNSANYEFMVIDTAYVPDAGVGIWSVIDIANIDSDPELEVLYTSSSAIGGLFGSESAPIVILDPEVEPSGLSFGELVVVNGLDSLGMRFKPGRILDDGQTIWLTAMGADLFSGNFSTSFRSTDGGRTFTRGGNVVGHRVAQLDAFDANTAVLVTAEGAIFRTTDGGANWTQVHSYAGGWFDGVRVLNSNVAVAYGDGMYFCRTTDQGATWTEITGIDYRTAFEGIYSYGMAACNVGETAWFTAYPPSGGTVAYIFKTTDAGATWSTIEIPIDVSGERRLYGISFADANNGMANANGKLPIYTTDGGATWSACGTNPGADGTAWVNAVIAIPGTNAFVALCDYELYYTTDFGDTWIKMDTPENTDDEYFISAVALNSSKAFFMTQQGTVVTFATGTGIVNQKDQIAELFKLNQNFPNPFNPTTSITFDLPQASRVELRIYDLLGHEVVTLVNDNLSAGSHRFEWNGCDKNGRPVAAGVYLYALKSGNITKLRKMTLVK
jgi:photosystem II stability/assembly factor-like uncharacterized protein